MFTTAIDGLAFFNSTPNTYAEYAMAITCVVYNRPSAGGDFRLTALRAFVKWLQAGIQMIPLLVMGMFCCCYGVIGAPAFVCLIEPSGHNKAQNLIL